MNSIDNCENIDEELFVRYAQFSAAPWRVLSQNNSDLCKSSALLHVKFAPYILELFEKNKTSGSPIIRHMEYEYPHCGFENVDTQFMLGDKVLVAPVIEKNTFTKKIYFPKDEWLGDDGSIVAGSQTLIVKAPLDRLPYFIKE